MTQLQKKWRKHTYQDALQSEIISKSKMTLMKSKRKRRGYLVCCVLGVFKAYFNQICDTRMHSGEVHMPPSHPPHSTNAVTPERIFTGTSRELHGNFTGTPESIFTGTSREHQKVSSRELTLSSTPGSHTVDPQFSFKLQFYLHDKFFSLVNLTTRREPISTFGKTPFCKQHILSETLAGY